MFIDTESPLTLTIHGVTLTGIVAILVVVLNQHKVWIRMKDRMNTLWHKYCAEKGEPFVSLDNGK